MRLAILILCIGVVAAFAAQASSYADFNAGIALQGRDDEETIRRLTLALADPALMPGFRAVALRIRADAHMRRKEPSLALSDYSASLAIKPDYDGYLSRGLIKLDGDDLDGAFADFTAAKALRSDLLAASYLRVRVFTLRDRYGEALGEETELLDLFPKYPMLYAMRADAYRGKGDYDAALRETKFAISLSSDFSDGFDAQASIHEEQGAFDDALHDIRNAVDAQPDDPDTMLHRGIILWELKHYSDAESAFAAILKGHPDDGFAALWFYIAYRNRHDDEPPAERFTAVDRAAWPGKVLAMLQGQATVDATIALGRSMSGVRRDQLCEAEFYGGQRDLLIKDNAAAEALLTAAARDCPVTRFERAAARGQSWH